MQVSTLIESKLFFSKITAEECWPETHRHTHMRALLYFDGVSINNSARWLISEQMLTDSQERKQSRGVSHPAPWFDTVWVNQRVARRPGRLAEGEETIMIGQLDRTIREGGVIQYCLRSCWRSRMTWCSRPSWPPWYNIQSRGCNRARSEKK